VLFTYPVLAADVFDYLMSGRLISAHHLNPYTWTAASAPQDPYYPPVGWKEQPSIYGPLWVDLMAAVTYVAGGATTAALLLAKALSVLAHLGAAVFVYLIARKVSPGRQLAAFVAYPWTPLVFICGAVDGDVDDHERVPGVGHERRQLPAGRDLARDEVHEDGRTKVSQDGQRLRQQQ